jgi:hypothetical protein
MDIRHRTTLTADDAAAKAQEGTIRKYPMYSEAFRYIAAIQKTPGAMKASAEKERPSPSNIHTLFFSTFRFNIEDVTANSTNLRAIIAVNQGGARSFVFRTTNDAMTYIRSAETSIYAPRRVQAERALAAKPSKISVRHITAKTATALEYSLR